MRATDHTKSVRWIPLFLLALGAFLQGSITPVAAQSSDELFEQYELATGTETHQTVLTGFLLGAAIADLAVVSVEESEAPRLRIHSFNDTTWQPILDAALRPDVLFIDLANIGGRDRLITYESGRLNWFDPDSETEHALVEIAGSLRATEASQIPRVDITRDLNHDGRDDLVVPGIDGFWVSTQSSDGSFRNAVKLGPPELLAQSAVSNLDSSETPRQGEEGVTAQALPVYLSRIHEMDYDHDGRSDLVFWNKDHFDVHLQAEGGEFDPVALAFSTDVPFDSDGIDSRALDYSEEGVLSTVFAVGKKTERTVLHSIRDLSGDGVGDLVTLKLAGRSITRQRSRYEVHLGTATPNGTEFARDVHTTIQPRGRAGGLQPWGYSTQRFEDFDGDGRVDILFGDVSVGLGGMFRALVGNSVPIDLEFYRAGDGLYPDKPNRTLKIRRFDPLAGVGRVFFPPVLIGDVDGDGRSDLLVGRSPKELQLFFGRSGPDLLARQPQKVAVALPYDERNTRLVNLNKDTKQDLLILFSPTDRSPTESHRVTLLVAR